MSDAIESQDLPAELLIELDPPLEFKGDKFEQLRLREPTMLEVRKAETHLRSSINVETVRRYNVSLVALVAGVDEPVLDLLPITKFNEAVAYLQGFIDAGRETGKS